VYLLAERWGEGCQVLALGSEVVRKSSAARAALDITGAEYAVASTSEPRRMIKTNSKKSRP
jgi:hypothetical protein